MKQLKFSCDFDLEFIVNCPCVCEDVGAFAYKMGTKAT